MQVIARFFTFLVCFQASVSTTDALPIPTCVEKLPRAPDRDVLGIFGNLANAVFAFPPIDMSCRLAKGGPCSQDGGSYVNELNRLRDAVADTQADLAEVMRLQQEFVDVVENDMDRLADLFAKDISRIIENYDDKLLELAATIRELQVAVEAQRCKAVLTEALVEQRRASESADLRWFAALEWAEEVRGVQLVHDVVVYEMERGLTEVRLPRTCDAGCPSLPSGVGSFLDEGFCDLVDCSQLPNAALFIVDCNELTDVGTNRFMPPGHTGGPVPDMTSAPCVCAGDVYSSCVNEVVTRITRKTVTVAPSIQSSRGGVPLITTSQVEEVYVIFDADTYGNCSTECESDRYLQRAIDDPCEPFVVGRNLRNPCDPDDLTAALEFVFEQPGDFGGYRTVERDSSWPRSGPSAFYSTMSTVIPGRREQFREAYHDVCGDISMMSLPPVVQTRAAFGASDRWATLSEKDVGGRGFLSSERDLDLAITAVILGELREYYETGVWLWKGYDYCPVDNVPEIPGPFGSTSFSEFSPASSSAIKIAINGGSAYPSWSLDGDDAVIVNGTLEYNLTDEWFGLDTNLWGPYFDTLYRYSGIDFEPSNFTTDYSNITDRLAELEDSFVQREKDVRDIRFTSAFSLITMLVVVLVLLCVLLCAYTAYTNKASFLYTSVQGRR